MALPSEKLKPAKYSMSNVSHLRQKIVNILLINTCAKGCGGCNQHCEIFNHKPKEQWHIPLKQLYDNVATLTHPCRGDYKNNSIGLHGGDITLHPQWKSIIEIIWAFPNVYFNVVTKKNLGNMPRNVHVWGGPTNTDQIFAASMVAPIDYLKINHRQYWPLAQNTCVMWRNYHSIVYNNRAYLCSPAGAYDQLGDRSAGWPVIRGEDPFDQSETEIDTQANQFCHRCMHCIDWPQTITQRISQPTLVSISNAHVIKGLPFKTFLPLIKLL